MKKGYYLMTKDWRERKSEIEKRYGNWLTYDIVPKGKSFYITDIQEQYIGTPIYYYEKIVNFAEDFLKTPLSKTKVLDLGCGEGIASLAFSEKAKEVLGIEGRYLNFVKADFTKKLLGLKNTKFLKDDVRNLNFPKKSFDVVLALGIIYHLDAPELYPFFKNLYKWTKEITIIDTNLSILPKVKQTFKGKDYFGIFYEESEPIETFEDSIGNKKSFWLTKNSLFSILKRVGFVEIYECKLPKIQSLRQTDDRITLIATKTPHHASHLFHLKNRETLGAFNEYDPWIMKMQATNYKAMYEPGDTSK
jgi:2-polyprenyl-3-methyl-5-hydroxy-6-metoxy-1,4-benzoquinol methylase